MESMVLAETFQSGTRRLVGAEKLFACCVMPADLPWNIVLVVARGGWNT